MGDRLLAQLPAEQHDVAINFAREVEQSNIEIFHLDAGSVDLRQSVFHARYSLFAFRFAASHVDHIDQKASLQKNAVREFLKLGLVDQLHVAITPILLGRGINLWDDLRGFEDAYQVQAETAESGTVHVAFARTQENGRK